MKFVKFGDDMLNFGLVHTISIETSAQGDRCRPVNVNTVDALSNPYRPCVCVWTSFDRKYAEFYNTTEEAQARMDVLVAMLNS